jgi:2'-5' RNA ligase
MSVKEKLRLLLEEKEKESKAPKYEYGCVMVFLDVDKKDWKKVTSVIESDDLYKGENGDEESRYGVENETHVTVLYGIHSDVPDEDVEKIIHTIKKPSITLKDASIFTNEKFDVVKYDINSPSLVKLNKEFAKLPHTTDHPDYHPHATIAYVKKGKGEKYTKIINKMEGLDITPSKIVYSKPSENGKSKKEYKLD